MSTFHTVGSGAMPAVSLSKPSHSGRLEQLGAPPPVPVEVLVEDVPVEDALVVDDVVTIEVVPVVAPPVPVPVLLLLVEMVLVVPPPALDVLEGPPLGLLHAAASQSEAPKPMKEGNMDLTLTAEVSITTTVAHVECSWKRHHTNATRQVSSSAREARSLAQTRSCPPGLAGAGGEGEVAVAGELGDEAGHRVARPLHAHGLDRVLRVA
jgi:hypothetical protein